MTVPNFFLVGAAKSGTSALTRCLSQHPQFSLPYKEPGYVAGWVRGQYTGGLAGVHREQHAAYATLQGYLDLYRNSSDAKVICDASTSSLPEPTAPDTIFGLAPNAKIMAILRQPVDRAFSHFNFNIANGVEAETDFLAFISSEPERIRQRWYPSSRYMEMSHYPPQVQRFQKRFDRDQLFLAIYEDWTEHPGEFLARAVSFLGLDESIELNPNLRVNETALPRRSWKATAALRGAIKRVLPQALPAAVLRRIRPAVTTRPRLDPELREELTERYFRQDILELEELLGRDLSHWLR